MKFVLRMHHKGRQAPHSVPRSCPFPKCRHQEEAVFNSYSLSAHTTVKDWGGEAATQDRKNANSGQQEITLLGSRNTVPLSEKPNTARKHH